MITIRKATMDEVGLALDGKLRGVWWVVALGGGKMTAIVSCPGCDEFWSLERWVIRENGEVSPSVDHSQPIIKTDGTVVVDCKFHDFVKLEGWKA